MKHRNLRAVRPRQFTISRRQRSCQAGEGENAIKFFFFRRYAPQPDVRFLPLSFFGGRGW